MRGCGTRRQEGSCSQTYLRRQEASLRRQEGSRRETSSQIV